MDGTESGIDIVRFRANIQAALKVEREEIQTKLALYGIEDFTNVRG